MDQLPVKLQVENSRHFQPGSILAVFDFVEINLGDCEVGVGEEGGDDLYGCDAHGFDVLFTCIHSPGKIIMLVYKVLRKIFCIFISPLKVEAEESGGEVLHARYLVMVTDHHVTFTNKRNHEAV